MKRLCSSIIIIFVSTIIGNNFAFAPTVFAQDDCPACEKAPKEVETYFAVMKAILNNLDITAVKNPDDTFIKDISAGSIAAIDAVAVTTLIGLTLPFQLAGDIFGEVKIQFMSAAMRRDRQRYVDMDYAIAKRLIGLQKTSRYNDVVPREVLVRIDSELKKLGYLRLAQLSPNEYRLEHNRGNYAKIIEMLWKINGLYKSMHQANRYHGTLKDVGKGQLLADLTPIEQKRLGTSPQGERPSEQAANTILLNKRASDLTSLAEKMLRFCKYQTESNGETICIEIKVLDMGEGDAPTSQVPLYTKIRTIEDAYDCAVGVQNVCEGWQEVRKKSFAMMKDRAVNDVEKSIQIFLDAVSRLKGAMFSPNEKDKEASNKRKEQLTTSYWGSTPHRTEQDKAMFEVGADIEPAPQGVQALWKGVSNAWDRRDEIFSQAGASQLRGNVSTRSSKEIKKRLDPAIRFKSEPLPEVGSDPDRFANEQSKKSKMESLEKTLLEKQGYVWDDTLDQRNRMTSEITARHIKEFQAVFAEALGVQYAMEQKSVFTDIRRVTMQFPALSASVYKNISMLGKKNDEGTLYNAMGKLCELQCTNVQGKCWYYTD